MRQPHAPLLLRRPLILVVALLLSPLEMVGTGLAITAPDSAQSTSGASTMPPLCLDWSSMRYLEATDWLDKPGMLTGTYKADVLVGSSGNDNINGAGGDDVICGSPTGFFGSSNPDRDTVYGGAGNDVIAMHGFANGGDGDDLILIDGNGSGDFGADRLFGGPWLSGGSGDDTIDGCGTWLDGGPGNDTVRGCGRSAVLLGGAGDDHITATGPVSRLDGGLDHDVCVGFGDEVKVNCDD
jgi:Ca2+-binding RTX toxin-like protein